MGEGGSIPPRNCGGGGPADGRGAIVNDATHLSRPGCGENGRYPRFRTAGAACGRGSPTDALPPERSQIPPICPGMLARMPGGQACREGWLIKDQLMTISHAAGRTSASARRMTTPGMRALGRWSGAGSGAG